MGSRGFRFITALGKTAVILLLGLLLTEVAFRVLHRLSPRFVFPAATYNALRPKPFTVFEGMPLNSHGFRDVEHQQAKPKETFRILGLGDSFAFGVVPYPDNFLTLLEQELDADPGDVEVINMGIPSIGIADYFSLLVNEGMRLDPDLVLLCFYLGNDFRIHPQAGKGSGSYLKAFLNYLFRVTPEYRGNARSGVEYDDKKPTFTEEAYLRVLRKRSPQFRRDDSEILKNLPKAAIYLENIRRLCEHEGVELVVAILPDEVQVDPEVRRRLFESMPASRPEDFDFDLPNAVLIAELERQGIAYLDLLNTFRTEAETAPVYKIRDTHWNLRGNRVAADHIGQALRSGDWLRYHRGGE